MAQQIILVIAIFLINVCCKAQSITVSGSVWTPTVSTITEAGNNYSSSTLTSASNQSLISITMPSVYWLFWTIANNYTVQIKRTDSGLNWDATGLTISAVRTGDGTGGGSSLFGTSTITGGTSLLSITTGNQYFFDGNNYDITPRVNIPIQYQISGISVLLPVSNYSTTITYTLIDN